MNMIAHAIMRITTTEIAIPPATTFFSSSPAPVPFLALSIPVSTMALLSHALSHTLCAEHDNISALIHEITRLDREFVCGLHTFLSGLFQKLFERLVVVENRNNDLCFKLHRELLRFSGIERALACDRYDEN